MANGRGIAYGQESNHPHKRVKIKATFTMKLQKDPKRVAQLAREREDENWRFRSFLKASGLKIEAVDSVVLRHFEDVSSRIDCRACGNCCRAILPVLSESDVERLASGLGISETELIDRFLVAKEGEGTWTFNSRPCPLLSGKFCTAYESRPDDCRSFPHLHKDEFVFRTMQVVVNCLICPIVFNVFERLKEELWHGSDEDWEGDWDVP